MPSKNWSLESRHKVAFIALCLSLFGLVMIYSASMYSAEIHIGDSAFYLKKQAVALIAGVVFFFLGTIIKAEYIKKFRYVVLAVSVILLALVFIPGLGVENYGATRWINLGFMTVQPSEFSKFGLMLFLACEMDVRPPNCIKNLIIPLASVAVIAVLIMLEPNMSITMTVGAAAFVLIFIGGAKGKYFAVLVGAVAVLIPVMILLEPYRMSRLVAYIDPWANPKGEGYQLIQSYYALGNGGMFGVGLFNSRQKYLFLPFAESDFIFAIIGEELGFIGSAAVALAFFMIVVYGVKIARRAATRSESLMAAGITAIIAVQSFLNVAVVSGAIPPTGLPLPFISAGGSSLMAFMFAVGILWRIDRNSQKADDAHKM